MMRAAILALALVLALSAPVCLAQEPAGQGIGAESPLPDFAGRMVHGESVVDLADFIAGHLEATGTVPDLAQVQTAAGSLQTLSAAEVFVLLARTAYLWRTMGSLPETVPLAPDRLSEPVLDAEDLVSPPWDPEVGREVSSEPFLAQSPAVVRWADRLQVIPTAVWVDGQRLSASEYLAGLAICISYAYWEGQLHDSIFLPPYAPPQSWAGDLAGAFDAADYDEWAEDDSWTDYDEEYEADYEGDDEEWWYEEDLAEPYSEDVAWEEPPRTAARQTPPPVRLSVLPEPGSEVSGMVDVVAAYSGPPAQFVIFTLGGRHQVMMNTPPYSYRWDTSRLEPGTHTIRVQVLDREDQTLADQTSAYTVSAPTPERRPGA